MLRTTLLSAAVAVAATAAPAAMIDFGDGAFLGGITGYSEDGFDFAFSGSAFIFSGDNANCNGFDTTGRQLELDSAAATITTGGALFDFTSVLFATSGVSGAVFTGTFADATTITETVTGPLAATPGAAVVTFSGFEDLVSLEIDGSATGFTLYDDMHLSLADTAPIPLPAGLPLLAAALGGLALLRRRG